jgi:hypothetical protein
LRCSTFSPASFQRAFGLRLWDSNHSKKSQKMIFVNGSEAPAYAENDVQFF